MKLRGNKEVAVSSWFLAFCQLLTEINSYIEARVYICHHHRDTNFSSARSNTPVTPPVSVSHFTLQFPVRPQHGAQPMTVCYSQLWPRGMLLFWIIRWEKGGESEGEERKHSADIRQTWITKSLAEIWLRGCRSSTASSTRVCSWETRVAAQTHTLQRNRKGRKEGGRKKEKISTGSGCNSYFVQNRGSRRFNAARGRERGGRERNRGGEDKVQNNYSYQLKCKLKHLNQRETGLQTQLDLRYDFNKNKSWVIPTSGHDHWMDPSSASSLSLMKDLVQYGKTVLTFLS